MALSPTLSDVLGWRAVMASLAGEVTDDVDALAQSWRWGSADAVRDDALASMPDVVMAWADTAAGLAADQYDVWRDDADVRGRFTATPAQTASEDQVAAGIRNALGSLYGPSPDDVAVRSLLSGLATRHVVAGAGDTIVAATAADPTAVGWSRHTKGAGACKFCRMLAGRGAVYRSEDSVRFKSHDNCMCSVAPSWDPQAQQPTALQYVASRRASTPSDRARVRAFLADMPD